MFQTRHENEQFDFLNETFARNRSTNGFISTDRPDSSQRVDLHVYLVPTSVWKKVQHLAQNEAMDDAVSAGFVRVSPDLNLRDLRRSIEKLCSNETFFPREFIFLRSVGRCLTRVKPRQEIDLKVKNYRPPQTFAPEIYLLEGRYEDHGNIPAASPALSSASYLFGNRYQSFVDAEGIQQNSTKLLKHIPIKTVRTEKNSLPPLKIQRRTSERNNRSNFVLPDSNSRSSTNQELSKVKEEEERLRDRQIELERIRRLNEERAKQSKGREKGRRRVDNSSVEEKFDEKKVSTRREKKTENDRPRREDLEKAAVAIQATFRGFKSRQAIREELKRRKNRSPSSRCSSTELDDDFNDFSDCEISSRSASSIDSNFSRSRTKTIKTPFSQKKTRFVSSSSSDSNENLPRTETVTKFRAKELENLHDSIEQFDQTLKNFPDRQIEQKRNRKDLTKKHYRQDIDALRIRLQQLRSQCTDLDNVRDDVIKGLKTIHERIMIRRKEARDVWKKKYYQEKKKTPSLEQQNEALKEELHSIQAKILQTITNESKHSEQSGHFKESSVDNFILKMTEIQHEIQDTRYKIDQTKLRLTTDIKLRRQAEQECQTLRHELDQAKMNLIHFKERVQVP